MCHLVYSLSGKSWRPHSSLGENVLDEDVNKFHQEFDASQVIVRTCDTTVGTMTAFFVQFMITYIKCLSHSHLLDFLFFFFSVIKRLSE